MRRLSLRGVEMRDQQLVDAIRALNGDAVATVLDLDETGAGDGRREARAVSGREITS